MSKKIKITLPDSGVDLQIKRVPPLLLNDIRKHLRQQLPEPRPPLQKVNYGDGDEKLEANPADPDYIAAVAERNISFSQAFIEVLIHYAVTLELTAEMLEEVKELREGMGNIGLLGQISDKVLYVSRVAVTSNADLEALQQSILGRTLPTEAAVAEAVATFPGAVQGA